MVLENKAIVVPDTTRKLTGHTFRPRLHVEHLKALSASIVDVLDCIPAANAQRHYIEALDMRVDEWVAASAARPRVTLADLDIMWTVATHKCGNVPPAFLIQLERMIEVLRHGGW